MPFSPDIRREIRAQKAYICSFCRRPFSNVEVHHKIPSRDGGSDDMKNAAVLCRACHDMIDREQEGGLTYEEVCAKLILYSDYL